MAEAVSETALPGMELVHRGKVRDVYDAGDGNLLLVATDRVSAFDCVMRTPVPGKGVILANLSAFWFELLADTVDTHYIASWRHDPEGRLRHLPEAVRRRAVLARRARRLDIECIVRGYLTGNAWRDYQRDGMLNGVRLPKGLLEAQELEPPRFTPSTKAEEGHDQPVTQEEAEGLVGADMLRRLEEASLELYGLASGRLAKAGLILADTKFEFGLAEDGGLMLIDEVFTPDSSRFWDRAGWRAGESPEPLDKEYIRSWLRREHGAVDEGVDLPDSVVESTLKRYTELYARVVGEEPPLQ